MAARILDRYRKASGAKPLPASGMIRIRLAGPGGAAGEPGREEVLWEPRRYRETRVVGRADDGRGASNRARLTSPTRTASRASPRSQVLRELLTRSYFWRRAWLFGDRERRCLRLGPGAGRRRLDRASTSSDGNTLTLDVLAQATAGSSRRGRRASTSSSVARSRFRDVSDPANRPVEGEVDWTGLPTGRCRAAEVGGGTGAVRAAVDARCRTSAARAALSCVDAAHVRRCRSGWPIDAAADGPDGPVARRSRRGSGSSSRRTSSAGAIAAGASLEVGAAPWPSLWVAGLRRRARRSRRGRRRLPLSRSGRRARPGGRPAAAPRPAAWVARRRATSGSSSTTTTTAPSPSCAAARGAAADGRRATPASAAIVAGGGERRARRPRRRARGRGPHVGTAPPAGPAARRLAPEASPPTGATTAGSASRSSCGSTPSWTCRSAGLLKPLDRPSRSPAEPCRRPTGAADALAAG